MTSAPVKLLATGGIRTVSERVEKPILYYVPGSFNAGKATLACQISQKAVDVEKRLCFHMRDNYTPEYARLNPDTMAVPTMQIDDKVATDSYDLCKYLSETYPGEGDQAVAVAGKTGEMWEYIDFCKTWDEYMFTYGRAMSQSTADFMNGIRLANLKIYLKQILDEKPPDMEFLTGKYIQKIAGITAMKRAQADGEQKTKDLEENAALLDRVLEATNKLAAQNPNGFLFGDKLTTADCFFLPILRIFHAIPLPEMFKQTFEKYPHLQGYWERAKANQDVDIGLMRDATKKAAAYFMFKRSGPKTMLAYKLGLLKEPALPAEIEERIAKAIDDKWAECRGT